MYALLQSVATPIDDAYEAQTEKFDTLKDWHEQHKTYSAYVLFNFITFPLLSVVILLIVYIYLNDCGPNPRVSKIEKILKGDNKKKILATKFQLQNEFTLSLTFVLLSVSLLCVAMTFGEQTDSRVHKEVEKYFGFHSGVPEFSAIYSILAVVLVQDSFIFIVMGICTAVFSILHCCYGELITVVYY